MRKLGLLTTLWTALLVFPLSSFALGLGEIEVSSFLNQPLKAEIEVVSARPGEIDDLLVSLASRDAFRKAGLDRPADLSKLRFKVEKSEDGATATILVTTKTPVKEPFLNFLVEADWAKGRLLREFTILLDPPFFAQQPAEPVIPAETMAPAQAQPSMVSEPAQPTPIADSTITQEVAPAPEPIALGSEPEPIESTPSYEPSVSDMGYTGSGEFVVAKGDTLWGIATQLQDDEHSMAQVMLALQAMNPDAFGQDNINNLKVGAVLRAPDQATLDQLSKQQAYAQVLEQNGLWDDYVARTTGAAVAGSPMATEGAISGDEAAAGQLSLLTPGDSESTSASLQNDENAADANQIRKQLALAEEELEAARLENDDLQSRISDLQTQLAKFEELQKLVQVEDSSLAQLQAGVTEEPVEEVVEIAAEEISGGDAEQPTDIMIEAADAIMSGQDEVTTVAQEDEMVEPVSDEAMPAMEVAQVEADEAVMEPQSEAISDDGFKDEELTSAPAPAPVIVTEAPVAEGDGGFMDMLPSLDSLLADPIMLGGIGAILLLLIGLLFIKRKKSASDEESALLEEPAEMLDEDATPIHVPSSEDIATVEEPEAMEETGVMEGEVAEEPFEEAEEEEDEFARTAVLSAAEVPEMAAPAATEEQDDVLNEVDVYLAYGLYDNAEELLKDSLQNTPERADYRAKLLDTYFATKNKASFIKEAEALRSLGGAADRYWDRVQIMGFELAPENDLFAEAKDSDLSVADLEYAKPATADFDIGADEDVTDFSNTDFDLSNDTFEMPDTQVVSPAGDDFSETKNLEDDIQLPDLDAFDEDLGEANELADSIGDIDLDLEDAGDDIENIDEDALDFDLPEDLDLSAGVEEPEEDVDVSMIELDPTVEAPPKDVPPMAEADDEIELDLGDFDEEPADVTSFEEEVADTQMINPVDQEEGTMHVESALDLDMSDMGAADLHTGTFSAVLAEQEANGSSKEDDITEFRPADVTGEFEVLDDSGLDAAMEVDAGAGVEKTGTFAPGDFDDDIDGMIAAAGGDADDIEGLMLPDDVDEVGTKLDLAKAFIDMGDAEGARSSLEEVLTEGSEDQKAEATGLLNQIK